MTKCVKPLSDLATLSAKSSKWTALSGRAGRLLVLKVAKSLSGLKHFVIGGPGLGPRQTKDLLVENYNGGRMPGCTKMHR